MSAETWATIPGNPSYQVSDRGRVRSLKTWRGQPGPRILAQRPNDDGYPEVTIMAPGGGNLTQAVHRLMALAFFGPRPAGEEVRHLDGTRTNNALSNLAYGTHSVNMADTIRDGTHNMARRACCAQGHPFTPENTALRVSEGGARRCKICRREQSARNRARRKAAGVDLYRPLTPEQKERKAKADAARHRRKAEERRGAAA